MTMTLTELTPIHKELLEAIAYESVATTGSSYARCADGHGTLTHLFFSDDEFDIARAKAICSSAAWPRRACPVRSNGPRCTACGAASSWSTV